MKDWKTIAHEKQAERLQRLNAELLSSIDPKVDMLDDNEQYHLATALQIVEHIRNEDPGWSAERVLIAFAHRAVRAHEATNCLTEIMFAEALEEARSLDREFAATKEVKGPLHGVPVSFKDQYEIKGFDASIGFTSWSQKPCTEDAELVTLVRAAGGIPFVKTNVPQTMLSYECANPVWGRTVNPYSANHTCGGSSGGEGALLACDGSALGFGSDIGGSLRIPTGFCGIYSLKPGVYRVPKSGARGCVPGFEAIKSVVGPMGRSVADVELGCRLTFGQSSQPHEWLPPVPYRDVTLPAKLKFGYYKSDGLVRFSPPVQRAVQETVDALREEGHECVEFAVPDVLEMARVFVALTSADRYQTLTSHVGPDPRDPSLFLVTIASSLPGFVRTFVAWAVGTFLKDPFFRTAFFNSRERTVKEFWAETKKQDDYGKLFYEEVWERYGFDGIICPVNALPTVPHTLSANLSPLAFATILYNVVDHPVGVVPVTRVDKSKDALTKEWHETGGPKGSPFVFGKAYEGKTPAYDAVAMHGIPVGIQVVGRAWEDEKVIEMMKVVDNALGKRDFGPGVWRAKQ